MACACAAVFLLTVSSPVVIAQDQPDPEAAQVEQQAREALAEGDMQNGTPGESEIRTKAKQTNNDPSLQHDPPKQIEKIEVPEVPFSGTLVEVLLIGTLVLCVVIVGYHLVRTYAPSRRTKTGETPLEVGSEVLHLRYEGPLPGMDEIERLARAGAYAEAIHLMLLRALDALRSKLGATWAKSLTSREIVRRSELGPTDRRALKTLVGAVEISRFGGQSANEHIYHACLDQYRLIGDEKVAGA